MYLSVRVFLVSLSTMLLLDIGAVPTVWYFCFLFLRCCYWILELFQQCSIFVFSFHDIFIRYWSCSNSVLFLFSLSTILLLDIGAVPIVWYFCFLFLRCCYWILELFQQSGIFVFSFYDVVIGYWSCSNSVVFLFPLSTMLLLDIGAVPTVWYFCFFFLRCCYWILELLQQCGIFVFYFSPYQR